MIDSEQELNYLSRFPLLITFFFIGFYAIIIQTVVFRELLVVALGNEIVFGISLFNWLIGVFFGARLGSFLVKRTTRMLRTFTLSLLFMLIFSPLATTGIRLLYHLSRTPAGSHLHFLQVFYLSAACIIPLSFAIGFTFPIASTLFTYRHNRTEDKVTFISKIYIVESLGSLLGGIVVSFILVEHFNSYTILSMVSLPLMFMLAFLTFRARHIILFLIITAIGLVDLVTLMPSINRQINRITIQKRWQGFSSSELVWIRDSRYQNLMLGKIHEQYNLYYNGQFSTSFPEPTDNRIFSAHLICQHPGPKKILIIGEAISGLARHLLEYNINKLKSIELDEASIEGIKPFLPRPDQSIFSDPRFSIQIGDGRKAIREKSPENSDWDIIFINIAEPSTLLLNRYYTQEFFRDTAAVLARDGILCLRITSSENYSAGFVSQYTASIYHTLKTVFPRIVIAPGDKNVFFASQFPGVITGSARILGQRYRETGVLPARLGLIFKSLYPREKTDFISRSLEMQTNPVINTDQKPVSLLYFNKILGWTSSGQSGVILSFFELTNLFRISIILFALLLARWIFLLFRAVYHYLASKKQASTPGLATLLKKSLLARFNIIFTVVATGFSGLSLEILIIYSFQNIYGYVYQFIGFIIALFMTGLPLGARISTKWMNQKKRDRFQQFGWLLLIQICFMVLALVFPLLLKMATIMGLTGKILICCLIALDGVLVGALFPVALQVYIQKKDQEAVAAGIIDASDHLGAAIGALFTGALLLPILGISGISNLIAIISAISVTLLIPHMVMPRRTIN